jgi:FHS family L-fucose permease-like MFS transporter
MTTPERSAGISNRTLASERVAKTVSSNTNALSLLYLVYFIYFFCGLTQSFEGVFLPEFKEYFHLNYQQQMYTLFAKNIPFLAAVMIGSTLARVGYRNYLMIAMSLYAVGTLLLVPGLNTGSYEVVLLGFFLIGSGFTAQMVAGNPLLSFLGPTKDASSRQNLGNALGAIAQIIAPAAISLIIPATAIVVSSKLPYMRALFLVLAAVLAATALAAYFLASPELRFQTQTAQTETTLPGASIWSNPKILFAFIVIFLCLGVEAGFFGFFRNYLEQPGSPGLTSSQSQKMFTLYFALFALGRLVASRIQKKVKPAGHLLVHLAGAILCLLVIMFGGGKLAIGALLLLGFFVSIFFPTLYSLAIEDAGALTAKASGLLTLGFLGCAILPIFQGRIADHWGLPRSYILGIVAYPLTIVYVLWTRARAASLQMPSPPE